ncbi:MAG: ribonuclease H-like domain-containing protein [Nitrospirota bacterium]
MIKNTFSILNGIGEKLEKRLWREGILTWDDFLSAHDLNFISPDKKRFFDEYLTLASRELSVGNATYFANNLKKRDHWRLFDIFKDEAACLDIETNGFMPERGGYVTIVGLYDGYDYKCFVKNVNLTKENLNKELSRYKYLITFYGAVFDVPFIKRAIPDMKFDIPHFDICFGSRRLGFKGGLKRLETDLGIERDESVRGMNGYDAVRLWEFAKKGGTEALDLLITYNKEDTVNLFKIADVIYQRLRSQTGVDEYIHRNH